MPGYKTHITWSSAAGVGLAAAAHGLFHVSLPQAIFGGVLCSLGGVLPDIDSDTSAAYQRCMSTVSGTFSLLLASRLSFFDLSAEGIVMASAFAYFFIYYFIGGIVKKLTVHRGMCHSIPFGVIAAELIFIVSSGDTQLRLFKSACVFFGVMIHLSLDELASLSLIRDSSSRRSSSSSQYYDDDQYGYGTTSYGNRTRRQRIKNAGRRAGTRIKKSFGTALKLIDYKHMQTTVIFYAVAALLGHAAMNTQAMLSKLGDGNAGGMQGIQTIERVKAIHPTQYDLSVVQWVAENDLVLTPGAADNKKWLELQDLLTLDKKDKDGTSSDSSAQSNEEAKGTLLDLVNMDSQTSPDPDNLESTSKTPRKRFRRRSLEDPEKTGKNGQTGSDSAPRRERKEPDAAKSASISPDSAPRRPQNDAYAARIAAAKAKFGANATRMSETPEEEPLKVAAAPVEEPSRTPDYRDELEPLPDYEEETPAPAQTDPASKSSNLLSIGRRIVSEDGSSRSWQSSLGRFAADDDDEPELTLDEEPDEPAQSPSATQTSAGLRSIGRQIISDDGSTRDYYPYGRSTGATRQ